MRVALSGITVRFGALTAVDNASLAIEPGEIHAVVGENGAGKTTLMNVLFGLVEPEAGTISLDGEEMHWASPQEAIRHGLGMVHQHFMLQESMTVLENVVLCAEPVGRFGFIDFAAARRRLAEVADEHGIAMELDRPVGRLSVGERQVVEVLKMLYREAEVLILDEPTSVLTPLEKDRLFATLRSFRSAGKAIVLITHKLDEVMELADRVSVMRAGRLVRSGPLSATSKEEIARGIIGGELPPARQRTARAPGKEVLAVRDLKVAGRGGTVGPLSLSVCAGEIVGIAGVSGNGQAELIQAITGLASLLSGEIVLCGRPIGHLDVEDRRLIGMSYIPEDRQRMGLALGATVSENANAGRDERAAYTRGPFLNRAAMAGFARQLIERYRIRVGGPAALASTMSGGNKQKLVVGRELARDTPLVIAENPTWGVDIGAIDFIHGELMRMRDEGHAVLLVSTELDEVLALSDRILVMYSGAFAGEVAGAEADRERIGGMMTSRAAAALPEVA
ncbi:ABC transporter ATP-binding protein [Chelativorans xinjiangense]|uniref:ABC transporter ATP-binding protein n=1 Tax=Chelativorans xinjiangense TaxID=2681485 RepID=UPI001358FAC6|nr:ABC transporter ATP-binding protein [Chelativorans xinjiangense]